MILFKRIVRYQFNWKDFLSKFGYLCSRQSLSVDFCPSEGPPLPCRGRPHTHYDCFLLHWTEATYSKCSTGSPLHWPPRGPAQPPGSNRRQYAEVNVGYHRGHWLKPQLQLMLSQLSQSCRTVQRGGERSPPETIKEWEKSYGKHFRKVQFVFEWRQHWK